ncbi:MAG: proline dehydrogenase family protein, partial [Acidobacteria bacterium]|nr:proline dehydrogenase family protein [Acidobacteriota bacterium]
MFRAAVLAVAGRPGVRRMATGGIGRRVALRFVAGEDLDAALRVTGEVNATGGAVSLDHLGENVSDAGRASRAAEVYLRAIDQIEAAALSANVSVKLTQLGLDVDPEVAMANAALVAHRAVEASSSITLDMEDHRYTDRTIDACLRLGHRYPGRVGVAIQAYLRRSPVDLERLVEAGVPVRVCKGAYREAREIAHRRRRDVDAAFAVMVRRLMGSGAYPMIATHDERLIRFAQREAERAGR